MRLRRKKRFTMLAALLLSPLFLLSLLIGISVVNPMGLAFLTTFEVINKTSEEVFVTPTGAVGRKGNRYTLPYSASRWLYVMVPSRADYPIPPGGARKFTYDWDDIQFSEVLVRRASGDYHVIPTGLHPTERQYRQPEKSRFDVVDLDLAPLAEEKHLAALSALSNRIWIIYVLAALGLLAPVFFVSGLLMKSDAVHTAVKPGNL